MVEAAHKISPPVPDQTGCVPFDRTLVWKRVLIWSSILTMLMGAALFATLVS